MTDKELLELAAKAAGIDAYWSVDGSMQQHEIFVTVAGGHCGTMPYELEWNPLKNDGDALRLAVKLEFDFVNFQNSVEVHAYLDCEPIETACEEALGCRLAATRRAIVRAAAAIGAKL